VSLIWLHPVAWLGVIAVAVPVLIHLLVRRQSRRRFFPSLRFLRSTAVASWRRQIVSDWPLLVVRSLILVAAVGALAAPIFVSQARRHQWDERIARAIVVVHGREESVSKPASPSDDRLDRERAASVFNAMFRTRTPADALRDAVIWLQRQPPSRREVLITGDLRRNSLTSGDLASVPPSVGIRFEPAALATPSPVLELTAVADNGDGDTQPYSLSVLLTDRATAASYRPASGSTNWLIVRAPASDQRDADAARAATLAEGVVNDRPQERRVTVVFPGEGMLQAADLSKPPASSWMHDAAGRLDGLTAGEHRGEFIVLSDVRAGDGSAVDIVARAARAALTPTRADFEPLPISADRLAAWSRPPAPADERGAPGDEGDRRWFWAAALALIAIEHFLRTARRSRVGERPTATEPEARVA
jgi:hypothetical protein